MQIEAGSIPAGAVAIIVIAAVAIGIGFMTLICSLINVAKNHRRAAGLQSLAAERVISPGACPSLSRRLPSLSGTGGHFVLSFFPHPLSSQAPSSAPERTRKLSREDAPPSYEEALRMAIEDSLRHAQQSSHVNAAVVTSEVTEHSSPPTIPPRHFLDMPLPTPQHVATESNDAVKESRTPEISQSSSHQQTSPNQDPQRENKGTSSTTAKGLNDELDQKNFEDIDLNQ